jgi:hypothetical protein
LRICAPIHRLFASEAEVLDRLGGVVARTVVIGEFGIVILSALGVDGLHRSRRSLMQEFATLGQQRFVGLVFGEGVFKGIPDVTRSWLLIDEFARL